MSFKPIYRFLKIKYSPAKKEDDKNSYSFTYKFEKHKASKKAVNGQGNIIDIGDGK